MNRFFFWGVKGHSATGLVHDGPPQNSSLVNVGQQVAGREGGRKEGRRSGREVQHFSYGATGPAAAAQ